MFHHPSNESLGTGRSAGWGSASGAIGAGLAGLSLVFIPLLATTGCGDNIDGAMPDAMQGGADARTTADAMTADAMAAPTGAVYAMSNGIDDNRIVVYERAADGTLAFAQEISTGGGGSGVQLDATDSLGSQGALQLTPDRAFLIAVNTETSAENADNDCVEGSISVLAVASNGALTAVGDPVPSGGLFPNSVTIHEKRLYVLNSGGPDVCVGTAGFEVMPNITGFTLDPAGTLTRIANSTQVINPGLGPAPDDCAPAGFGDPQFDCGLNPPAFPRSPGQVSFTPSGDALVVTVKGTNSIHVFPVDISGAAGTAVITYAPGPALPTYFGFAFDPDGNLIVSEPFGAATAIPMAEASAVSSFEIMANGSLQPISSSVGNDQTATCWVAMDPITGEFAYTANNGTSTISTYSVAGDGTLGYLRETDLPSVEGTPAHPNDLAVVATQDENGDPVAYLYSLNSGTGHVSAFRMESDGALTALGDVPGLPEDAGAQGLAGF